MRRKIAATTVFWVSQAFILNAADKVTYDDHVLPLFQQTCLNCHNPDKTKGGLDLSTYAGAMKGGSGGKIAEPGDAGSKLIVVVMQTGDPKMPPEGEKLGGSQIEILKAWIEGGLLENKSSSARKPSKPKFDTSIASAADQKPDGPPPLPQDVLLEPPVHAARASSVHAMATSPWAPLLAVTGQKQVLLFDTNTLELAGVLPFPEGEPVALAFTPNARYLIVGGGVPGKSGLTVTFDVVTGERMLVAGKEFDSVLAADLKPDLSMVATGSPSRLIKVWKAEDGSQLRSIKKHTDWVTALDFSPDGILLATGDRNGGVWVWEADSGNEYQTLRAHQAAITATSFRADSNLLASASEDGTVRFWEMSGGSEVKKLDAHGGGVLAFAWARDGSFITSGRDKKVKLWKADFNLLREYKDLPDLPVAVAIDSEGKRAFAADYRGQVSVWDIASGNPVGNFDANPPSIEGRLAKLREEIAAHPQALAASEGAANASKQKLEEARKQLADAQAAIQQAKDAQANANKLKQESEQKLAQLNGELPGKKDAANQARAKLDEATKEVEAKKALITTVSEKIAATAKEQEGAAAELKRLEEELAKARNEKRDNAIAGLEAGVNGQRPKLETATANLEASRSEKGREEGALGELENRKKAAGDEFAKLDGEAAALAKEAETLPKTIADAGKTAGEAEAAIKQREAGLKPAEDAIPPVEKAANDAVAQLEQVKQKLAALQASELRWAAAEINTQAIKAKAEADKQGAEAEGLTADFEALKKAAEEQPAALNEARKQAGELEAKHVELAKAAPAPEPNALAESEKAVAAGKAKVAELEKKIAATKAELPEMKAKMEQAVPAAQALKAKAEELKAKYLAAKK
ncbi:c-type cytochrome domain-containing protein [Haloferula sp. BvORR071]|uniref:c-type cytochrome domain-containing protein n=1 Tax=Haloferula sp. BvORR071 TaxID=1396141 RepID=UPI000695E14E|nr:c-type cytochrome domain-containing protein [Haloferula sp. BvORR071]